MSKIFLSFSVALLALLGACATSDPVTPAPVPVVVTPAPVVTAPPPTVVTAPSAPVVVAAVPALRAGNGRIESISALPPSAAAGGSSKMQRIGVRMDDGTFQYVDTAAEGLHMAQRVEITTDGQIRR